MGPLRDINTPRYVNAHGLQMDHGIHFISGLPRSGSTLLAGILRQNPR